MYSTVKAYAPVYRNTSGTFGSIGDLGTSRGTQIVMVFIRKPPSTSECSMMFFLFIERGAATRFECVSFSFTRPARRILYPSPLFAKWTESGRFPPVPPFTRRRPTTLIDHNEDLSLLSRESWSYFLNFPLDAPQLSRPIPYRMPCFPY
jgi:hypothetical protein